MTINPFQWVRQQFAQASVQGIADGIAAATANGAVADAMRRTTGRALPDDASAPGPSLPAADDPAPAASGGRRKSG